MTYQKGVVSSSFAKVPVTPGAALIAERLADRRADLADESPVAIDAAAVVLERLHGSPPPQTPTCRHGGEAMTSTEAQILAELRAIKQRLAALAPLSDWPRADQAAIEYGVSKGHLRRLARQGKIRRSEQLPLRYYRGDLESYFTGVTE